MPIMYASPRSRLRFGFVVRRVYAKIASDPMMLAVAMASAGRITERQRASPGGVCARSVRCPSTVATNQRIAPSSDRIPMRCDASRTRSGGSERTPPCDR
jgi:hypothetical protein